MQNSPKLFNIKVSPNSSRQKVEQKNGVIKVYINSSPEKGKANKEVLEVFAKYLGVRKSSLKIIKGKASRNKIVSADF